MTATHGNQGNTDATEGHGKFFTFFVDGKEFRTEKASLSCGEIMDIAGVPRNVGLIEVLEDGTEKNCPPDEVIVFEGPGRRFKRAPRFRRG